MKVLVTGANGQLGLDLLDEFASSEVVGFGHADLDVADEAAVVAALRDHEPDVVIHAGAWTDVDGCELDPDRAHAVNALGSWWVARACHLARARMVMISTDYVFDGAATTPYTEFDPTAPVSAYGRSKEAGERLVRATLRDHAIVRTAWVCGARGKNFVRTMLRVGREQGSARVVDDQVGSPTFTRDLAAAVREVAVSGRDGTFNRTNSGTCSWFEFAAAIFELAGLDVDLSPMESTELDRPAPRPSYSVLSDRHSVLSGLREMPHWRDGLERMLGELADEVGAAA